MMLDFSLKGLLISFNIISIILVVNYIYLPLRIPLKWIPVHMAACISGGYLLTMISFHRIQLYDVGIGAIIEYTIIFGLMIFCEGNIFRNFMCQILVITFSQITILVIYKTTAFAPLNVAYQEEYSHLSNTDIFIYNLIFLGIMLLYKPLILKLMVDTERRRPVYFILTMLFLLESVMDVMMRRDGMAIEQRIMTRVLFIILVLALLFLAIAVSYRKAKQLEGKRILAEQKVLADSYQDLWKENQKLHFVKHEVARHMREMRSMKEQMPQKDWEQYLTEVKQEMGDVISIPCTGNIGIDALMMQQYKKAEAEDIILESVLEPLEESFAEEHVIMMMLSEMFAYAFRRKNKPSYVRCCLRRQCGRYLLSMEIGLTKRGFYRQKLIDQIGDELIVRQALLQTRYLVAVGNGGWYYRLKKNKMHILVMV